jgi:hypothetical protein
MTLEPSQTLVLVQIAAAKDHLYGMTSLGAVWRFNEDRQTWEPISMTFSAASKRRRVESPVR